MFYQLKHFFTLLTAWACLSLPALAEESPQTEPEPRFKQQHPQVVVTASPEDPLSGTATLTPETLEALPGKDGSLNESLAVLPGVQLPDTYRDSTQGGEILPPEISISGGRPYDNLISVDGISVSSRLDPASTIKKRPNEIPSTSNALTLSRDIVEEATLYRYNIPARYGGFTGGVVDVSTRNPDGKLSCGISYRTTQDAWTEFFIAEDEEEDFYSSKDADNQPHFRKHQLNLDLDLPMFEQSGLLASYSMNRSEIPLIHFGETKEQKRQTDNLLLKFTAPIDPENSFSISSVYSKYVDDTFREDTYASDYTLAGEGLLVATELQHQQQDLDANLLAGITYQEDSREGPSSFYSWDITPSKPWGSSTTSKEGGYGNLYRENLGIEISPHITARNHTSKTSHSTTIGAQYSWDNARQERPEDAFFYFKAVNVPDDLASIDCSADPLGCIDNEQQITGRYIYPAGDIEVEMNQVSFYTEHQLDWESLSLRPGLRYTTDDFQNNSNIAPRMALSVDMFGDGNTLLSGGANRYYSEALLSYKLREFIQPTRKQNRDHLSQPSAWPQLDNYSELSTVLTRYSDLKTPYSDEYAAAIDQSLFGGRLRLEYIRREGYDEFSREKTDVLPDGHKYYELNNNGRSRHEEYSLNFERTAQQWAMLFNVTYQETSTSNLDYDDTYDETMTEEMVLFEGEIIPPWQLPRKEYNRPLTGNLILAFKLPFGFSATNATRYLGPYRDVSKVKPTPADLPAEASAAWEEIERKGSWITDWKIEWETATWRAQTLTCSVEILNVFNEKYQLTDEDSNYSLGRQFWAGLSYSF